MARSTSENNPIHENEQAATDENYTETLERVKKQYQQYLDIADLYNLPYQPEQETTSYQPPSPDRPLTTNTVQVN